jgi:thiamine biosynthesis lipoprotein
MTRTIEGDLVGVVRAMASDITIHGRSRGDNRVERAAIDHALGVFPVVDAACTRFAATSPLMQLNAQPDRWHSVPTMLYRAILEAHGAYERTRGRFDPRILQDLVNLGYDHSLPFADKAVVTTDSSFRRRRMRKWKPRFRGGPNPQVHLGGLPIDLGGIGKGLAVRWAVERLDGGLDGFLVDAGGDCMCGGPGPDGDGWRVGVEDPRGGVDPLAVLELRDVACATSSVRLRRWKSGGREVHHLIDPRTGRPGGVGMLSVTVVASDPAEAEVVSKTLFLLGREGIGTAVRQQNVAALWVDVNGAVTESPGIAEQVIWRAS